MDEVNIWLHSLNIKNPEEKLIYQIVDLSRIKNRFIDSGLYDTEGVLPLIDRLIYDWEWLYQIGLNTATHPDDSMTDEQKERYEQFKKNVATFESFIGQNMEFCSIPLEE